jgi:hypothetical protein
MNPSTPGDTTVAPPSTEPVVPATNPAPSEPPTQSPNGSEPDTNPGGQSAMVPSERLREETEKRRQAEEELRQLREAQTKPAPSNEEDLDPEVVSLVQRSAKKLGFVTEQELAQREMQVQVRQDVRDLETQYANSGVPYKNQEVLDYAKANNMPITSKAALRAAYRDMNADRIAEVERQRIIAELKESGNGGAEKPGSGGAKAPTESKVEGGSPKERNRNRIQQARQRLLNV